MDNNMKYTSMLAASFSLLVSAFSATLEENVTAVEQAAANIDSAIRAKQGVTQGGLTNAAAGILSIPDKIQPIRQEYVAWSNAVPVVVTEIVTNAYDMYSLIPYLQGSGNQYIDLGRKVSNDTYVKVKVLKSSSVIESDIFGDRTGSSVRFGFHFYDMGVSAPYGNSWFDQVKAIQLNAAYELIRSNDCVYVNGEEFVKTTGQQFTTAGNAYLFAQNNGGSPFGMLVGRIYECVIADGEDTYSLVPALDQALKPCMVDLLRGVPYYNCAGGADFTYEQNVTNKVYARYEIVTNTHEYVELIPYVVTVTNAAENAVLIDETANYIYDGILENTTEGK